MPNSITTDDALSRLSNAYHQGDLSLYLGAGVSVANGLPNWEKLVISMYIDVINEQGLGSWRPFVNYLYAIAEWHLDRQHEPLEVTARKLRMYYETPEQFLDHLRRILYAGFSYDYSARFSTPDRDNLRTANSTLDAVAQLCESNPGVLRAVITYNYDCLLEIALGKLPYQSFWKSEPLKPNRMPIYHVHGYVPLDSDYGSNPEEIVFTEEQYHRTAQDPYFWSNLVQIQHLSNSVGLMVGLSLTDRNMRRLLDAIMTTPQRSENYAFIKEPNWQRPADNELTEIHENAQKYLERINSSGGMVPGTKGEFYREEIAGIINAVSSLDKEQDTFVLEQLGVYPIWYREHHEIASMLQTIINT